MANCKTHCCRPLLIFLSFSFIYLDKSLADCKAPNNNLEELTDHLNCQPSPTGTSLVIDDKEKPSPSGLPRKFILRKKDDSTYQVQLNLKFLEDDFLRQMKDLVTEAETPKEAQMRNRVNYCLKQVNPYLKGPNNQRLEISLTDRKSNDPNVKKIETPIVVGEGNDFQVNSLAYKSDSGCLVILHEILHRLGLVDEYIEIRDKLANGNKLKSRDCRILGSPSSIMNNAALSTEKDFINRPKFITVSGVVCQCLDVNSCSKPDTSMNCDQPGYKKEFRRIEVVENADLKSFATLLGANFSNGIMGKLPAPAKVLSMKMVKYDSVPTESFLLPAHFRYITLPLCKKDNYKYATCASRSNNGTTSGFLGIGKTICENPPTFCSNGEWLQ